MSDLHPVTVDDDGMVPCPRCTGDGGEPLELHRDDRDWGPGTPVSCPDCDDELRVDAYCEECERDARRRGIYDPRPGAKISDGAQAYLVDDGWLGGVLCVRHALPQEVDRAAE